MTHDELLAKIDAITFDIPADYGQFILGDSIKVVLELHKPQKFPFDEYLETFCVPCDSDYPCPTIQAIKKELS